MSSISGGSLKFYQTTEWKPHTCLSYCYVAVTKHSSRSNLREKGSTLASPFKEIVCHVTEDMAAGRDIMVAEVRGWLVTFHAGEQEVDMGYNTSKLYRQRLLVCFLATQTLNNHKETVLLQHCLAC